MSATRPGWPGLGGTVEPLAEQAEPGATIVDDAGGKPGAVLVAEPVQFSLRRQIAGGRLPMGERPGRLGGRRIANKI